MLQRTLSVRVVRAALFFGAAFLAYFMLALPAPWASAADGYRDVYLTARVNGQPMPESDAVIDPRQPVHIELTIRNDSTRPLEVRSVGIAGEVFYLPFFGYETTVRVTVPAGGTVIRDVDVDAAGIRGQATGLLPVSITVRGVDHKIIAVTEGSANIRGSLLSVYGIVGIALGAGTLLSWLATLISAARRRLPPRRGRRALRFLPAGVGSGLTAVVGLSISRVASPTTASVLQCVAATTITACVMGALVPGPALPGLQQDPQREPQRDPRRGALDHPTSVQLRDAPTGPMRAGGPDTGPFQADDPYGEQPEYPYDEEYDSALDDGYERGYDDEPYDERYGDPDTGPLADAATGPLRGSPSGAETGPGTGSWTGPFTGPATGPMTGPMGGRFGGPAPGAA